VTVSLQAFTNLHDVHFFVPDRSLAPFVAISPAHIRHLKKHAVLPVTITFSMPAETAAPPSSALQGVIAASADDDDRRRYDHDDDYYRRRRHHDDDDDRHLTPLQFVMTISDDNTVACPDANNNSIRDDVDQYIQQTFTDPGQKAAAAQFASALQAALLHASDKNQSLTKSSEIAAAIDCIWSFNDDALHDKIFEIEPLL